MGFPIGFPIKMTKVDPLGPGCTFSLDNVPNQLAVLGHFRAMLEMCRPETEVCLVSGFAICLMVKSWIAFWPRPPRGNAGFGD